MTSLIRTHTLLTGAVLFVVSISTALAQTAEQVEPKSEDALTKLEKSPWLIAPVFQANPKLGVSGGALAGYLHYFDEKSRPSIFAVMAQYTSTESIIAAAVARASFDEDHQRVVAALSYGRVKNDYDDYLGTGVPLKNNAEMRALVARYLYRVTGNWFLGVQGISQNFNIAGDTGFDDLVLDTLGVVPFKSVGVGFVVQNDSRDSDNSPTKGWLINFNNLAYRESLGSEQNSNMYRVDLRYYMSHGNGHVLAFRQLNQFTDDAPVAQRAPVQLRGYKVGQYTGINMSSIEAEERYSFNAKWRANFFAGVACLYGGGQSCTDNSSVFPMAGLGVQYVLKPKEGIVLNLEYALGRDDNQGVYLKMKYAY